MAPFCYFFIHAVSAGCADGRVPEYVLFRVIRKTRDLGDVSEWYPGITPTEVCRFPTLREMIASNEFALAFRFSRQFNKEDFHVVTAPSKLTLWVTHVLSHGRLKVVNNPELNEFVLA